MGRIILHNWEVETKLNIVLNISSTRFQITGSAIVSYRSDDFSEDTDSMITFSNRDPFTVMMDGEDITDWDDGSESEIVAILEDIVIEVLEDEISLEKTDITDEDFETLDFSEVEELLVSIG